jgi:hypothetical protein
MKTLLSLFVALGTLLCMTYTSAAQTLTISGKITADGTPIRGVTVFGSDGASRGRTNKEGVYTITAPKAGTYTITPFLQRRYIPKISNKTVALTSNENKSNIDFELEAIGEGKGVIMGRIRNFTGQPIEGIKIRISKTVSVLTDRNGVYRFINRDAGRYFVFPSSENYTFQGYFREIKLRSGATLLRSYYAVRKLAGETYSTYATGLWNIDIKKTGGTCALEATTIDSKALLTQRRSALLLSLPRLGGARGTLNQNAISLQVGTFKSPCFITGTLSGSFQDSNNAKLTGTLKATCMVSASNCTAEVTATLDRAI